MKILPVVLKLVFLSGFNDFFSHSLDISGKTSRVGWYSTWIVDSVFREMTVSDGTYGGAIFLMQNEFNSYVVIERCAFEKCDSNLGGAFYLSLSSGFTVLNKICGYDCGNYHSNVQYMFGYCSSMARYLRI